MPTSATQILHFLQQTNEINIVRHEISSADFSILRSSLRKIAFELNDSGDQEAIDVSMQLRVLISHWLTTPLPFDNAIQEAISELFGDNDLVQKKWGKDIREFYELAHKAAIDIVTIENPVRVKIAEIIEEQCSNGFNFKIYCHRRAKPFFKSLLPLSDSLPVEDDIYLHSVKDYRESEPFDSLIKVGALRSNGWGSAPDAILTAPRFRTLYQVVWSGCNDEPGFGYDPTFSLSSVSNGKQGSLSFKTQKGNSFVRTNLEIIRSGSEAITESLFQFDVDELQLFKDLNRHEEKRSAVLLHLGETHGMLYPPYSRALSYDPENSQQDPIAERIPGDSLIEGMFLIISLVDDIEFDGVTAKHGHFSRAWKSKLKQEYQNNADDLIKRLRAAGLNLLHLKNAVRHWRHPPSTVIHAPQLQRHFNILLRTINFHSNMVIESEKKLRKLLQSAWNEVRRSRGEAIQAGVHAQEIILEELQSILNKFIPKIQSKASTKQIFTLKIPDTYELHGQVLFLKVNCIESGFRVPATELKTIRIINEIDQWRE